MHRVKICEQLHIYAFFYGQSSYPIEISLSLCLVFSEAGATFTHYVKSKTKLDLYLIKRSKFHTKGLELKTKKMF